MYRKLFLFIVSIIGCNNYLDAQAKVADSLHNLLISHIQEDTIRVSLLNDLAYEYRRGKPAVTDSLIQVSLLLAEKINYARGKGYALAIKGGRYYNVLKYKSADSVFTISKQLLESVKDYKSEAYLLRTWANMKMDEGDYSMSLDNFLTGLKIIGLDDVGVINKITNVISGDLKINIAGLTIESGEGLFQGTIKIFVHDKEELEELVERLKGLQGIQTVDRFDMDDTK